ncbi:PQQ-dependent sugar dehydrogenase [Gracilibacillus sp. D59]|uniref:PQQ-dependent sugar dehydrogenase n=1 Tax=Gracilibacillus sp. D59 TaxID=3457434 RepID=UPI003FCDA692
MDRGLVLRVSLLILFFVTACSAEEPQSIDEQPNNSSELENKDQSVITETSDELEVIAEKLNVPWSIEKLNDTFYLTERPGNIVKIENGEVERQHVELKKELATTSEAGLLGFVLDKNFSESNLAYAYYTYQDDTGQFNRIVTLRLEGNTWMEEKLLLDKIPSGSYHHGGRLKVGPDNKLYATTGDATEASIAQENQSLGGKILRMNLDGSIPDDNPFEDSYVYSLGHRNPQGITWDTEGTLYESEHGNSANDEVNQIEAGQNYGWPIIEGNQEQEGMIIPLFTSGDDTTWAPSGIDYHDGKIYVAALRGTAVMAFDLETGDQSEVITNIGRVRDVLIEDDHLYVITNNTDGRGNPEEADDILFKIPLSDIK